MRYFVEWCPRLSAREGRMVDMETLRRLCRQYNPGYRSVYMFDEDSAIEIMESGSSRGFDRYTVYADRLTLDIDEGQSALTVAETILLDLGLAFTIWESGGKGFHIEIPHKLIGSPHLPYSHRRWVEMQKLPADLTLYQHGRIVSLPGRIHPKTRRVKEFCHEYKGSHLELPIMEAPVLKFDFDAVGSAEALQLALANLANLSALNPVPGQRHTRLWGVAKDLARAGISYNATLEILTEVNNGWENAKPPEEVANAVNQAYRHLVRGN